jgi:outer membrane protein
MVVDVSNPQTPILYAAPSIDITKEIIELYDKSAAQLSTPPKPAASNPTTPAAPKPPAPANPTKKQ